MPAWLARVGRSYRCLNGDGRRRCDEGPTKKDVGMREKVW